MSSDEILLLSWNKVNVERDHRPCASVVKTFYLTILEVRQFLPIYANMARAIVAAFFYKLMYIKCLIFVLRFGTVIAIL